MKNLLRLHALLISMLLDDSGGSDSDSGDSDSDSGGSGDASLSSLESAEFSDSDSNSSNSSEQRQPTETSNPRPPVRPEDLNQLNLGDIPPQWDPNNLPPVPPPGDIQPPGDWPGPKA